jgi:hypothetical protein
VSKLKSLEICALFLRHGTTLSYVEETFPGRKNCLKLDAEFSKMTARNSPQPDAIADQSSSMK